MLTVIRENYSMMAIVGKSSRNLHYFDRTYMCGLICNNKRLSHLLRTDKRLISVQNLDQFPRVLGKVDLKIAIILKTFASCKTHINTRKSIT